MDINSLIVSEKIITAEYPDPAMEGLEVKICYLSRSEIKKIRNKCVSMQYNRKTHQPEEQMDDDLFLKLYVEKVVLDWSGMTAAYLSNLMPIDISALEPDANIEYSKENALSLMKNSVDFDAWLSGVVSDLTLFNKDSVSKKETSS